MTLALPPIALLDAGEAEDVDVRAAADRDATTLRRTLAEHGADITMGAVEIGPQAVRYLLAPGRGVLPSKVEKLADALSLAIGRPVRFAGQVGTALAVEVSRAERTTLRLRDLIETGPALAGLGLVVGGDVGGQVITAPLAGLPHLLIAGATGQGKSVAINALLTSLLMRCTPEDLQLVMVDPKRVELAAYSNLPHLMRPIVTDVTEAADALREVTEEMDLRYERLEHAGVKDIRGWNDREAGKRWPRIVVVIDELADLMAQAKKSVEPAIARIAAVGRAAGVHLIVATQYPRADVVTPLIKQNIPSRLCFTVADHTASNLVLGSSGAERLSGAGDALWAPIGELVPVRVQAPFVTEEEVQRVVAWWYKADEPRRVREGMLARAAESAAALREQRARERALTEEVEIRAELEIPRPPREVPDVVITPHLSPEDQLRVEMIREARAEADRYRERLDEVEKKLRIMAQTIATTQRTIEEMTTRAHA